MCRSGYCVQCKRFAGVVHFSVQELCRWEWVAGNGSKSSLHEVFMGWKERQACIPCKVDCLHLTGCTICILPQTPLNLPSQAPSPFPSLPPQFCLPHFYPLSLLRLCRLQLFEHYLVLSCLPTEYAAFEWPYPGLCEGCRGTGGGGRGGPRSDFFLIRQF